MSKNIRVHLMLAFPPETVMALARTFGKKFRTIKDMRDFMHTWCEMTVHADLEAALSEDDAKGKTTSTSTT